MTGLEPPITQHVAQRYTTELSRLHSYVGYKCYILITLVDIKMLCCFVTDIRISLITVVVTVFRPKSGSGHEHVGVIDVYIWKDGWVSLCFNLVLLYFMFI
jgi:hypothetical protein